MKKTLKYLLVATGLTLSGLSSWAEESNVEKVQTAKNRAIDATKKAYRGAKNKLCPTVNGKVECAKDKMVNKANNVIDKAETDAIEQRNKIDNK